MMRLLIVLGLPLFAFSASAAAKLKVITTTSDLAQVARAVGGDRVDVESIARGYQNPHYVDAKPSFIVKLIDADAFIRTGLELESGWEPVLVESARNRRILPGNAGFIDASEAVEPKAVPADPTRAMGDVHPGGNPHYMLDPRNAIKVARHIAERFAAIDPPGGPTYRANADAFGNRLQEKIAEWRNDLAPFAGATFVSYHDSWPYFADFFGLSDAGQIEPKPGIPPTASHTADLIERMNAENVRMIFTDPWFERRTVAFIAERTGAAIVEIAMFPGAYPGTETYVDAMDHNVTAIKKALRR